MNAPATVDTMAAGFNYPASAGKRRHGRLAPRIIRQCDPPKSPKLA
jgi:hypothetical protein